MSTPLNTSEMQRELRATLAARREMGPEYEDHLVESFVQKVVQQLGTQLPRQQQRPAAGSTSGQRLALAIVSLALLVPMVAIVEGITHSLAGLAIVCFAVVLVNATFGSRR